MPGAQQEGESYHFDPAGHPLFHCCLGLIDESEF